MSKQQILGTLWWTPGAPSGQTVPVIGIVAFESYAPAGHWKAYVGFGLGRSEAMDARSIVEAGVPIGSKEFATALFPDLDPKKFKY